MNPFLFILEVFFVIAWLVTGVALTVWPVVYTIRGEGWDGLVVVIAAISVTSGLCLLLILAALMTGGVTFSGHGDGCFWIHTEGSGKAIHQVYTEITCR